MKTYFAALFIAVSACTFAQGHDMKPAEAMKQIQFITGEWKGKQDFVTGGAPMVGDIVVSAKSVVGSRYIEETLSTTLPGRKPTDSRHMVGFDPKINKYKAWWYNDTNNVPMQLEGNLEGDKLVLMTSPGPDGTNKGPVLRATYEKVSETSMKYMVEMKTADGWQALFHNTYSK